tara:strand:+ start:233 stop:1114 length:882 start_codon:yes stop_codon:yes gene_type:complete
MDQMRVSRSISVAAVLLASVFLAGCPVKQSIGKSTGAFLHPVSGPDFVHIENSDWDRERNALLYFYRPHSQWASDEIESPSVYVDERHYFNIRNDSFTWLEVAPGERHIIIRRPLLGLEGLFDFDLSRIADAVVRVDAGKVYYLRYNEVTPPSATHPELEPEHPLASGDLQLVTRDVAMADGEIRTTQFLNSDMLAPNHAAVSISETNIDDDYERHMDELEEAREEEIEALRLAGQYEEASWYWPFGGGPIGELETDRRMAELEASYAQVEAERERKIAAAEAAEEGSWWWPF